MKRSILLLNFFGHLMSNELRIFQYAELEEAKK